GRPGRGGFGRVRLRVAGSEAALKLIQRRRPKAAVSGATHRDAAAEAVRHRCPRVKRPQRLVIAGVLRVCVPTVTMSACDEREPIAGKKRVLEKGRRQMLRAA